MFGGDSTVPDEASDICLTRVAYFNGEFSGSKGNIELWEKEEDQPVHADVPLLHLEGTVIQSVPSRTLDQDVHVTPLPRIKQLAQLLRQAMAMVQQMDCAAHIAAWYTSKRTGDEVGTGEDRDIKYHNQGLLSKCFWLIMHVMFLML